MSIVQKRNPPPAGQSIVTNALRDLWQPDPHEALGGAAINLSQPLPVYSLQLADIDKADSINKAKSVGWRYLMEKAGGAAYADLVESSAGEPAFASLSRNRNAERLNQAAHLAEKVADGGPTYEARILDVPALHISAIWLLGLDSKFIPYIDPERLRAPDAEISVDHEFLDRLTRRAKELRQLLPDSSRG